MPGLALTHNGEEGDLPRVDGRADRPRQALQALDREQDAERLARRLKQTWRLGLIDADAYRAADVENINVSDLLSGRTLAGDEIADLFKTCAADATPKGAGDAAMLAVFYGCGLRAAIPARAAA